MSETPQSHETGVFPRGERYLLAVTLIWGSTFSVTKVALDDIAPLMLQGLRFALAACIVGIYTWRDIRASTRESLRAGLMLGVMLGGGFALQTVGLVETTASKAGFLTGTLVVFTPLLQMAVERRMPTWGNLAGVVIVAVGLYIFTSPDGATFNTGDALILGCAVVFAFHVVYLDVFTSAGFRREIVFYQFAVTSVIGFVAYPFVSQRATVFTGPVVLSIVYLAVFASAIAIFVLSKYQRETTPTRAALIYTMEPVMAAAIAALFIGERLEGETALGGAIMLAGLLTSEFSTLAGRRRAGRVD
ncbi:MAG: DMT family transporter [Ignavibacteriae bacterium]|nr:DMT family transporter [Ignavibacteriota bacterium]